MFKRLTVRERIILLAFVLCVALFGAVVTYWFTLSYFESSSNSVSTEKIIEKQVYLENSQTIESIKSAANSMVTIIKESAKVEFLSLAGALRKDCFSNNRNNCGMNAVVLTSDGIVATVNSDEGDLDKQKLLAFDKNGREMKVKFLAMDNESKLVFFQLFLPGNDLSVVTDRGRNYGFMPMKFADLKLLSVGQRALILRGNVFNGLANLDETLIKSILRADQVSSWPIVFSSEQKLSEIGGGFNQSSVSGNVIADLNGGLIGLSSAGGDLVNSELIKNYLAKYRRNSKGNLSRVKFELSLISNTKQLAAGSALVVDYGYIVSAVKPASIGQKLGLKANDLIVEIDGVSLLYENIWNLLENKIQGEEIKLKVLRGKETLDLKGKL